MVGNLKSRLREGQVLLGTFVKIPSLATVEILGELHYDFIIIDMEHSPLGYQDVEAMIVAADGVQLGSILRIAEKQEERVIRALDLGCDGIQAPMVANARHAHEIVRAGRYHPLGERSVSFAIRGARYGLVDPQQYLRDANEKQLIVAQIESWEAVEAAEEVAATPGVDVLFVGPADLSQSLGIPGRSSDPKVREGIRLVGLAAKKHGKILGTHVGSREDAEKAIQLGVTYLVYGTDIGFFVRGAKAGLADLKDLAAARKSGGNSKF